MRENIRLFSAQPSDGRFVGRTRRIKIVPNGTRSSLPCLSSLPFPFYHYHHCFYDDKGKGADEDPLKRVRLPESCHLSPSYKGNNTGVRETSDSLGCIGLPKSRHLSSHDSSNIGNDSSGCVRLPQPHHLPASYSCKIGRESDSDRF